MTGGTDTAALLVEAHRFFLAEPGRLDYIRRRHIADQRGRCRACTLPGYGTAHAPWPCSIALLAGANTAA